MNDTISCLYRVFDVSPLRVQDADLRVELDETRSPRLGVAGNLARYIARNPDKPSARLLTGHRGSGKSTELNQVRALLEEPKPPSKKFYVVRIAVDENIDLNDVEFFDVLTAIVRQTAADLKVRFGKTFKPSWLSDRLSRFKQVLGSEVEFDGLEIDVAFGKLATSLRSSPPARRELRRLFEPDAGLLLNAVNDWLGDVKKALHNKGFAGLVLLVDELDKMAFHFVKTENEANPEQAPRTLAEQLFVDRSADMTGLCCHIIYTVPLELAYSAQQKNLTDRYGGSLTVIPMVKIRERPPSAAPFPEGVQRLEDMIRRRADKCSVKLDDLFESADLRQRVVALSGGQPSELMTLIRDALDTEGKLPITGPTVDFLRNRAARDTARPLRNVVFWKLIEQIRTSGSLVTVPQEERYARELLWMRAVLQYVNGSGEWYAPSPYLEGMTGP